MINNDTDLFKAATEARKRRETINEANNLQEIINREKAEKTQRKSQRQAKIEARKKEARRRFLITFTTGVLAGALATVGITGLYNDILKTQKIKSATKTLKEKAQVRLVEEGLATRDEDGKVTVLDNEISDYRCLDLTNASLLETHIYYEVLGKEFDDAIQTASYGNNASYDENADKYTGTKQWFTINGFFDKDTREVSAEEEYVVVKPLLIDAYEHNCEGIIRTAEEIAATKSQGRGY